MSIILGDGRETRAFRSQLSDYLANTIQSGGPISDYDLMRLYATSSAVYAATRIRARNVAQVKFVLKRRGEVEPVSEDEHPVAAVLAAPIMFDLLERMETSLCIMGLNLLVQNRAMTGRLMGLQWVNPGAVQLDIDPLTGALQGFKVSNGVISDYYPNTIRDVIYTHYIDLADDYKGVSPARNAFTSGGIDVETSEMVYAFMKNRALPFGIFQPASDEIARREGRPSKSTVKQVVRLLQDRIKGSKNTGRVVGFTHRWEWKQLQSGLSDLQTKEIEDSAQAKVCASFEIPVSMIGGSTEGYAAAYQGAANWFDKWFVPYVKWYGRSFHAGFFGPQDSNWTIEPDTAAISTRDTERVTGYVTNQLNSGIIMLNEARDQLGYEPDEELDGLYIVGGAPVNRENMQLLARERMITGPDLGWSDIGDGSGGSTGDPELTPPRPPDTNRARLHITPEAGIDLSASGLLSGDAIRELRNAIYVTARKGVEHVFEPEVLTGDEVAYTQAWLAWDHDLDTGDDDANRAMRTGVTYIRALRSRLDQQWQDDPGYSYQLRAYAPIERRYKKGLYELVKAAFSGSIDRAAFEAGGHDAIRVAFTDAYREGLREVGVTAETLTDTEQALINELVSAERGFWTNMTATVYDQAIPLRTKARNLLKQARQLEGSNPELAQQLRDTALELKRELIALRETFFKRLDLWTQRLNHVYQQGKLGGKTNNMLRWKIGQTKEHCRSCSRADGQVHRASTWNSYGLYPGSNVLECVHDAGGIPVCGCYFVITQEAARGKIKSIPRF